MSYDIFVQDIPSGVASVTEIAENFKPQLIGSRSHVISTVLKLFPNADFSDPSWGKLNEEDCYNIEINLGSEEELHSFAFHVSGGASAMQTVSAILNALNLRAFDPQTETGLFQFYGSEPA